jgi:hypothetical protein
MTRFWIQLCKTNDYNRQLYRPYENWFWPCLYVIQTSRAQREVFLEAISKVVDSGDVMPDPIRHLLGKRIQRKIPGRARYDAKRL